MSSLGYKGYYGVEICRTYERERESNSLKSAVALCVVFICALVACFYLGFQNSANAALSDVTFNTVSIRNGAVFHLNGSKTLTAIDGGASLFADNASDNSVANSEIQTSLASFHNKEYGGDQGVNALNNASLINDSLLKDNLPYIKSVNNDYWLEDTSSKYGFDVRKFRTADNSIRNLSKVFTGKNSAGYYFFGSTFNLGNYGVANSEQLESFDVPEDTFIFDQASTG